MAISREGWQKERDRSLICCHCVFSCQRATCKKHVLLFEGQGPFSELYVIVFREEREGIGTGAETQRQIQVLVLSRVRIHSFPGHWREDMVHEVVTGVLVPQKCRVSMPTSNSCKDPQQHSEGSSKISALLFQ